MADAMISTPKGPSALDLAGLKCRAMSVSEIQDVREEFARTAVLANRLGFGGVEILPIGVKLNATDQLEGGLRQDESLSVVAALAKTSVDLIDISGGTYFPGAPSSSDRAGSGPYFLDFAARARAKTDKPLMVTGGFKTLQQAKAAIEAGKADLIGLARALIVDPDLPQKWEVDSVKCPQFPRFYNPPEGGVTAWYTMQMTQIANGEKSLSSGDLSDAIKAYEERDQQRRVCWTEHFRN